MSIEELNEMKEKEIREEYETTDIHNDPTPSYFDVFKAGFKANEIPSGNQYTGYLKEDNQTWSKIHPNEPIFILRGQDVTAPEIILKWIAKNLDTVEESKIKEAFQTVLAMRRYDKRRDPT